MKKRIIYTILVIALIIITALLVFFIKIKNTSKAEFIISYICEDINMHLPGSFSKNYIGKEIHTNVIDDYIMIDAMDINGFDFNGKYEVYTIDKGKGKYVTSGNSNGAVFLKKPDGKKTFAINFYYDKKELVRKNKPEMLSSKEMEYLKEYDDIDLYSMVKNDNSKVEKVEKVFVGLPFVVHKEIDAKYLDSIDTVTYYFTASEEPLVQFDKKDCVAVVNFKIIDGKYILDDWYLKDEGIELLRTTEEGEAILVNYHDEYKYFSGIRLYSLINE